MLSLEFRGLFVSFLLVMVGKQRVMRTCNTLDWFSEAARCRDHLEECSGLEEEASVTLECTVSTGWEEHV
ncbi:MAG: hypothetical protein VX694_07495 [Planctomycetota bacterium]|nr:hypothetical protein [Planctomycetota bacterium]